MRRSPSLKRANSAAISASPVGRRRHEHQPAVDVVAPPATRPRRSSVPTTPVSVPLVTPASMARSRDSISPHTHSTHITVKALNDRPTPASTVRSRWLRAALATRNTLATAAIEREVEVDVDAHLGEARLHVVLGPQQVVGVAGRQRPAHRVSSPTAAPRAGPLDEPGEQRIGRPRRQQLRVPLDGDDVVAGPLERLDRAVGAAAGDDPPVGARGRRSGGAAS